MSDREGQHDFDFFMGDWNVHHRRLRSILRGANDWYEFHGKSSARPMWGGSANTDEITYATTAGETRGLTLRLYDAEKRIWSLYWASAQGGLVTTPTVGRFNADGTGDFFNEETFDGRPVVCRYRWIPGKDSCRWEQAFSTDGGATWEDNWTMDFTRISRVTGVEPVSGGQ